jgi:hypothetical protein
MADVCILTQMQTFFFTLCARKRSQQKNPYAYTGGQHILRVESAGSRYKPSRRNVFAHCFYIATHETTPLFNIPRSTHISGGAKKWQKWMDLQISMQLSYAVQNISKCDYKKIYSVRLHTKIFSILTVPGSLDGLWRPGFDSRQRQNLSLLDSIHTGSGAHLASYPMGT